MLHEAQDFLDESETLAELLDGLAEADWNRPTQFKNWTADDVIVHLHFWNKGADLSLNDSEAFMALYQEVSRAKSTIGMRAFENNQITKRGRDLFLAWRDNYRNMARRWIDLDPKTRVKWAGPDMSVRSSISARQMETWSHGQAVFDLFGQERVDKDRIRNIVFLGVNTFQWGFKNRDMEPPEQMPYLKLTAPSGELWTFGDPDVASTIEGSAVEFCQVVAQTRSYADTALKAQGEAAELWMKYAQCFAGPAEQPPAPGTRTKQEV